ncbi:hypothetical protein BDV96DRAFT_646208 [Lophiotrema nucula]|uniref:Uncharacterized protein n=1 Tax=Lophiotrema nucula TaxID=690887 RepID=A0A6A5Z6W2_9PLEO|nr:hypothetical protein BDV96DRAFT_646208 [Lophiotrema nucula]
MPQTEGTTTPNLEKMTSIGSGDDVPSPPHPTPVAEARDEVDSIPAMDMSRVSNTLETIAEDVNEAALPSPPVNTPEALLSPAPSVKQGRGRGFSVLGDRLQLKHNERRRYGITDTECDSSIAEEDSHLDSAGKKLFSPPLPSPASMDVPIVLGAPTTNPPHHEYLDRSAGHDLGDPPSPRMINGSMEEARGHAKNKQSIAGVTENSNWADDIEQDFDNVLKRLEQLAQDEAELGQSMTREEYYMRRLRRFLTSRDRMVPVTLEAIHEEK